MGGYATEEAVAMGRTLADDNNAEIIRLDDYRKRYALYRLDADLQAAHQRHPFIVIWDDHELANDTWKDGAENHQSDTEGDFLERKLAALAAYFEWMPIVRFLNHLNIYRQFNFGNCAVEYVGYTYSSADKQLDYADYLTASGLDIGLSYRYARPKSNVTGIESTRMVNGNLRALKPHGSFGSAGVDEQNACSSRDVTSAQCNQ
jgi:alkaline phosphatase D